MLPLVGRFALPALAVLAPGTEAPPSPRWAHPVHGAPALHLVSHATIRRWDVDYLTVAYYADPEGLHRRPAAETALERICSGQVWCGERVAFLRGASARRRREIFDSQFKRHWPGGRFDPTRLGVRRFYAATARPLEAGDRMDYLVSPDGVLHLRDNDGPWVSIRDTELCVAFLKLLFVGDPENADTIRALQADLTAFDGKR